MHCRRVGDREYLVVLARDEKVAANLLKVAGLHGIEGGWVSGLGSIKDIELGYYELSKKVYLRRKFEEDMELAGFGGNISMVGPERVLHAHCCVSGPELISFAGHLFEARVAVTAEFLVRDFGVRLDRADVPEVGLKLLQPGASTPPARRRRPRKGAGA